MATSSEPRGAGIVSIGGVSVPISTCSETLLVPEVPLLRGGLLLEDVDQHGRTQPAKSQLAALRWMMQKSLLRQDMFLLGPPGPLLRHTAFRFCQILNREVEYVGITRDTCESDLKQRCEIRGGTVEYVDQAPVRAAIHGRVLVLEGIEKAERNVLPLLNNLLENREMSLEDRRFLLSPERAAVLRKDGSLSDMLVPVHPDFIVIALGLPERGNPLDPPLRSRFAALRLDFGPPSEALAPLARLSPAPLNAVEQLLAASSLLRQCTATLGSEELALPGLAPSSLGAVARLLGSFPGSDPCDLLKRVYPAALGLMPQLGKPELDAIESVLAGLKPAQSNSPGYCLVDVCCTPGLSTAVLRFAKAGARSADDVKLQAPCGALRTTEAGAQDSECDRDDDEQASPENEELAHLRASSAKELRAWLAARSVSHVGCFEKHEFLAKVEETLSSLSSETSHLAPVQGILRRPWGGLSLTPSQAYLLSALLADHAAGADVALVGEKGSGKSALARAFASLLGYRTRTLFCYRDMSSRDLLQRRSTDPDGGTSWHDSPLVEAAVRGELAVLDGVHRLAQGMLYAALGPLIVDRAATLPDGTRLLSHGRWERLSDSEQRRAAALGVRKVHPAFRILALGELPELSKASSSTCPWVDDEVATLFHFHVVPLLPSAEQRRVARAAAGDSEQAKAGLMKLQAYGEAARQAAAKDPQLAPLKLSLRALLRAAQHLRQAPEDLFGAALRSFASRLRFLGVSERAAGERLLREAGITATNKPSSQQEAVIITATSVAEGWLELGGVRCALRRPLRPELVPEVSFVETPSHMSVLREMLLSWTSGQHLLLVGNQGVGKNKLADRLLGLLCCEREYVQLHRDTTVQSLTLAPSLEGGVVVWADSPLLRAVKAGRCLLVDEADKAPLEVVCVLKALAEDGELALLDGRTIVRHDDPRLAAAEALGCGSGGNRANAAADEFIPMAEGFRLLVLANRPGFPFLGNDFYRVCGDVFDCHAVDCLDAASERQLLRSVAPTVPEARLEALCRVFGDLRRSADSGEIVYPYSTRELAKLVAHAELFPGDSLERLAADVFGFDAFDAAQRKALTEVLRKHGIAKTAAAEAELFGDVSKASSQTKKLR